jgi:hypothetical protein
MAAVCVLWVGNCRLCCEMGWRKAKSLERTRLSVVHGPSMHRWLECYEGYLLVWPYVTALRTSTVLEYQLVRFARFFVTSEFEGARKTVGSEQMGGNSAV